MSAPSILSEHSRDGTVVLVVRRGLKGEGEAILRDRIDELVRDGHRDILIDLAQMQFIDSSELGRLIRSHIAVRQAGGRVRLCNLVPRVAQLMRMTKLDTVLEIYDTVDDALAEIVRHRERGTETAV